MDVTPCSLDELSHIQTTFGRCSLPSVSRCEALVVTFRGEVSNSREHFGGFATMRAMVAAGVFAWSPQAVVLDLRGLVYEWGDNMAQVLAGDDLPRAVVVSDLNREGLMSLVEQEMFAKPEDWLFESIEEAVAAVDRTVNAQENHDSLA
jgi:hypothetical protein